MSRAALHIIDAGITLLDSERVHYRQPGLALLEEDTLATGNAAFARARINPRRIQHRYWSDISAEPLTEQPFRHLSTADLVSKQLEIAWAAAPSGIDQLAVAVPAYLSSAQLGLFLGIAAELKLPVTAMADAAVAATRREYRGAVPVHIDIGLHHATLCRIAQQDSARVERSEVIDNCGLYALNDAWLNTVAEAFVRQSRFDPLHTAETEQLLLDQLGSWLNAAGRGDTVALSVTSGGVEHSAEIESLALINAAAPWYQQIASRLRALFRAGETPALQMTDRAARLPGLAELLKARVGGEVFALEPGATARGALARCRRSGSGEAVSLLRQLPWDQQAVSIDAAPVDAAHAGVPTHLLHGDVAWRIDGERLCIGTRPEPGGRAIELDPDMPGISRHHCDVLQHEGRCVVEDHSRYGTFLNGHRIDGSTVLQVGDALRVGSPGFEFRLITTDESHGA